MWIRTNVKLFCSDLIRGALLIGKDGTGSFHDQFEVLCGLDQMCKDAVMTYFEFLWGIEQVIRDALMTYFEVLCGLERV
jgi:hypothetical protein